MKIVKCWTCGDMALIELKKDIIAKHYTGDIEFKKDKEYELKLFGFGDNLVEIRIDNKSYDLNYKDIYKITRISDDTYKIYDDEGNCIEKNYTTDTYYHPSFYDDGEYS